MSKATKRVGIYILPYIYQYFSATGLEGKSLMRNVTRDHRHTTERVPTVTSIANNPPLFSRSSGDVGRPFIEYINFLMK